MDRHHTFHKTPAWLIHPTGHFAMLPNLRESDFSGNKPNPSLVIIGNIASIAAWILLNRFRLRLPQDFTCNHSNPYYFMVIGKDIQHNQRMNNFLHDF